MARQAYLLPRNNLDVLFDLIFWPHQPPRFRLFATPKMSRFSVRFKYIPKSRKANFDYKQWQWRSYPKLFYLRWAAETEKTYIFYTRPCRGPPLKYTYSIQNIRFEIVEMYPVARFIFPCSNRIRRQRGALMAHGSWYSNDASLATTDTSSHTHTQIFSCFLIWYWIFVIINHSACAPLSYFVIYINFLNFSPQTYCLNHPFLKRK